jgi:RNA-directed DNA polymerase
MGLRLSPEKTLITHIDEGLDFLGWRIQRHRNPGQNRPYVYTYPAKKALAAICPKIREATDRRFVGHGLAWIVGNLNRVLRGWCGYCVPRGRARSVREEVRLVA